MPLFAFAVPGTILLTQRTQIQYFEIPMRSLRTSVSLASSVFAILLFAATVQSASAQVSVNVSSPSSSSVGTSFTVQANASSPNGITGWYVYVDGNDAWHTAGPTSSISAPLSVGAGGHTITVRAWDTTGASGSRQFSVSASTSTSTPTSSSGGTSVNIQSPGNGATVGSPVTFQANGSSPNGISGWVIYADGQNVYQVDNNSNSLTATVNMSAGSHSYFIRAWDRMSGYGTSPTVTINVGGSSSGSSTPSGALPTPPWDAKVFSNIEDMSGFKSCSANCAGGQSTSNFWMAQYQGDPSMDGSSVQFFNGGNAWANVLWYKPLAANNWASHFLWDFYVRFDYTTINNLHTAEFDFYQSINGIELMVGSQCNFGEGAWDIWNQASNQWIGTSIPCRRFSPDSWHHIQWYVERASSNQYRYVTLVVDGTPYSLGNRTYYGTYEGWSDLIGVQWQLDLGPDGVDAHEWVDKVKLSIW
jgi:hypothetical protein